MISERLLMTLEREGLVGAVVLLQTTGPRFFAVRVGPVSDLGDCGCCSRQVMRLIGAGWTAHAPGGEPLAFADSAEVAEYLVRP